MAVAGRFAGESEAAASLDGAVGRARARRQKPGHRHKEKRQRGEQAHGREAETEKPSQGNWLPGTCTGTKRRQTHGDKERHRERGDRHTEKRQGQVHGEDGDTEKDCRGTYLCTSISTCSRLCIYLCACVSLSLLCIYLCACVFLSSSLCIYLCACISLSLLQCLYLCNSISTCPPLCVYVCVSCRFYLCASQAHTQAGAQALHKEQQKGHGDTGKRRGHDGSRLAAARDG